MKPHGALYNDMMKDDSILQTVLEAVADFPQPLKLMLQASTRYQAHQALAYAFGLDLIFEAFADRRYDDEGYLVSRQIQNSVLDEQEMLTQVQLLIDQQAVISVNNNRLEFPVDSICVHGDNATGIAQIEHIRNLIDQHEL